MAKTIGQLTAVATFNPSTDEFVIEQSGQTFKVAASVVRGGLVNANIDAAAAIEGTKIDPDFGAQNVETTGAVLGGPGTVFSGSSSGDMVRITQTGAGNALIVEDATNPDSTPFVVDATGTAVCGHTAATSNATNLFEAAGVGRRSIAVYSYSSNLALGAPPSCAGPQSERNAWLGDIARQQPYRHCGLSSQRRHKLYSSGFHFCRCRRHNGDRRHARHAFIFNHRRRR
jgi:hypothetical protein